MLLSSELFKSPETEVDNFADQLERDVTSALDAVLSLQQVFFCHFRHLFLFHITFITWCSPRLCLRSHAFSQFMSHLLLQLYPFMVSIISNMLMIHSFLSSLPLYLYLAVSAASCSVFLLFTAGSSTMVLF